MKKNFLMSVLLLGSCHPAFADKWTTAARAGRILLDEDNREYTFSFLGFIIDLFIVCIPVAIISGIVAIILRSVFHLNEEDTMKCFLIIGGGLLAIWLFLYIFL